MKTKGMFWHVHHDVLLEYSHDINERVAYIKAKKPKEEVPLRLKLMKPVRGKLPDEVVKAYAARDKANAAYDKAYAARDKAYAACVKAYAARDKADAARDKAIKKHMKKIEALHKKECPDCPWDGKTIFPKAKQ
jgi:uncharacterized protein YdeI (YjbR/CyaY-like superfamily)